MQEGCWERRRGVSGDGSLASRSSCAGLQEWAFREAKANGGPFGLLNPTPAVTGDHSRAASSRREGERTITVPIPPHKTLLSTFSIPKTFSMQDQLSYAARDQDRLSDTVAGGMGEEMTLAAVFGMH